MRAQASGRGLHNVPAELTSFVGRRHELADIKQRLGASRLVTLTGPGGVGKTRLALRASADLVRAFPNGVWLIELAAIEDPPLVTQAVFHGLGLQDTSGGWSLSKLTDYLSNKHLLLVLDNCEHLLDSCAVLASSLLKSCPQLRVLATSRQALGVTGETRMRVPPLSLPEDGARLPPERIAAFEAVTLLSERATAVLPSFKIGEANSAAVLKLCRRLDGIPLALELAAVRLEGLTVEQVVQGLERELPVLAKGSRGAEARQQTLDAAIGWSYGLLDDQERLLWARLSVFAGGFEEAAAVAVCSGAGLPPDRIAENLASLVEKSIVQRDPDRQPARYSLLETVRQYGRMRLHELGEDAERRSRHRDWILRLAQEAGSYDHREAKAFSRIRLELDNVWSALDFCRSEPGEAAVGIDICLELYPYWWSRGPLGDVRRISESFLPLTADGSVARARCLSIGAVLALIQNDFAAAQPMLDESMRIGRETDNAELVCIGSGASLFAAVYLQNKTEDELLSLAETVVAYGRSAGLGTVKEISAPRWFYEATGLNYLSVIRMSNGALEQAVELGVQAVAMCREHGELWARGQFLNNLSEAWRRKGNPERAEALAREGAAGKHAVGDRRGVALLVETLAWMAADRGASQRAAVLLGYAQRLRESIMVPLLSRQQSRHAACEQSARSHLGDPGFAKAFERGATMPDADAIAYVLEQAPTTPAAAAPRSQVSKSLIQLTRREDEIAALVAQGLSNKQIAAKLVVSERTVESHIWNILNKLGFNSRVQIASWAATEQPLATAPKG